MASFATVLVTYCYPSFIEVLSLRRSPDMVISYQANTIDILLVFATGACGSESGDLVFARQIVVQPEILMYFNGKGSGSA